MPDTISPYALSELIGSIYDCVLDPANWDRTLRALGDAFRGDQVTLTLADRRSARVLLERDVGIAPEDARERHRHGPEVLGVVANFVESHSPEEFMVISRHIEPRDQETSPFFQHMQKIGLVDALWCFLIWTPELMSGFSAARISQREIFTEREIGLGGLLFPHLRRAALITHALDAHTLERERMAETLDTLRCGVALTTANGQILHANCPAERMMRQGKPIRSVHGVLQAADGAAGRELQAAIRLAARDETELGRKGLAVPLSGGEEPVRFAHVLPLAGGDLRRRLDPRAVAAVFISAGSNEGEEAEAMAAAFGLTPSEKRLLESLLAGRSLTETAAKLGVAMTTAKTHLEKIFQKTGVNRQTQLMRLAAHVASPAGSQR
jgi:DNA-binding CsgD family transcriptional regulator